MASQVLNSLKKKLLDGSNINFVSDTIKVALFTTSFVPNIDTQAVFSDLSNELVGTGYTAGGAALGNKTVTQDNTGDDAYFDADDSTWATATFANVQYAVIYKSTGVASTSPLIAIVDFGSGKNAAADTFYIQWDVAGILKLT